jgi:hypothetical protein
MADTSTFMPMAQLPSVDYGAVYRNAKARRELEEERKLQYLNQFQQERGAFTPGMQDELQSEWDAIEADLDSGDMSFEAKARRQRMYNTYKDHASSALNYTTAINNLEASVLADPSSYNDPAAILSQLQQSRELNIPVAGFQEATAALPKLASLRRFQLQEISPNAAAGSILQNLKTSGGINKFYDMEGTGALDADAIATSVGSWFNTHALSQEEEDQAIAYVMHQQGALDGSMKDLSNIKNLTDEQKEKYIGEYAQYVTQSLTNMLADDIETEKEKTQRELSSYRTKARIQAEESAAATKASTPEIFTAMTGDVQYMPPITADKNGRFIKSDNPELVNAGMQVHALIEGTQPSYMSTDGNQYHIESIGINNEGKQVAVVRYNQSVIDKKTGETEKYPARKQVLASEIPLTGLSNAKQADKIVETYNAMLPYWSKNFAGRGVQSNVFEQDVAALAELAVESGPMQDVPVPPEGIPFNAMAASNLPRTEYFPDLTYGDYVKAGKQPGGQSKIITDLIRENYGSIASLSPEERIQAREDIKLKLSEQFGVDIK